jgi:hypothetical protein
MSDDSLREEINNVYNKSLEDIQFLKQQQWKVVYYCLLLFSAVFYLNLTAVEGSLPKGNYEPFMLIVSILICFFGLYFLIDTQFALKKYRERVETIRKNYFQEETKKLFGKKIEGNDSFWNDWEYFLSFCASILFAFGFIFYTVCKDSDLAVAETIFLGAISSLWGDC